MKFRMVDAFAILYAEAAAKQMALITKMYADTYRRLLKEEEQRRLPPPRQKEDS